MIGKGLKICSRCPRSTSHVQHSFISRRTLAPSNTPSAPSASHAEEEVFVKTLGFACALKDRGCAFEADDNTTDVDLDVEEASDADNDLSDDDQDLDTTDFGECFVYNTRTRRPSRDSNCRGHIVLKGDKFGRSYVQ